MEERKNSNLLAAVLFVVIVSYKITHLFDVSELPEIIAYPFSIAGYIILLLYSLFYYKDTKVGAIGISLSIVGQAIFIIHIVDLIFTHGAYENYVADLIMFILQLGCYISLLLFFLGRHKSHVLPLTYSIAVICVRIIVGILLSVKIWDIFFNMLPIFAEIAIMHDMRIKARTLIPATAAMCILFAVTTYVPQVSVQICDHDGCNNPVYAESTLCEEHYLETHEDIQHEIFDIYS